MLTVRTLMTVANPSVGLSPLRPEASPDLSIHSALSPGRRIEMRIVTWNMNSSMRSGEARARAWEYLRNELRADLALVQEAVPPPDLTSVYCPIDASKRHYNWGSVVVALRGGRSLRPRPRMPLACWDFGGRVDGALPESHPGATAVPTLLMAAEESDSLPSASMRSGR